MVGNKGGPPAIKSFACQSCGAAIQIRAQGLTVTAVCSGCGSISESQSGEFQLIVKSLSPPSARPCIALGKKGRIRGREFQVIGFMRRFELDEPEAAWDEYLLYNPYNGFSWLSESNGHWTLYRVTKGSPGNELLRRIQFAGETFEVFHRGNAVVHTVLGEFYWQVRAGDRVETIDAICPPRVLSQERDGQEITWSLGEYLTPEEVKVAFSPHPLPDPSGVAPNQPTTTKNLKELWITWEFIAILLLVLQCLLTSSSPSQMIRGSLITIPQTGLADFEATKFSLDESSTHVALKVTTTLNQTWATVSLRVVPSDPTNAAVLEFEKDFSYYSGFDSDGSWREGDPSAEFLLNRLPRGEYHVLLTATPEPGHSFEASVDAWVAPRVWSNFWLALLLVTIPPVWSALRWKARERRRWSESEYSIDHQ